MSLSTEALVTLIQAKAYLRIDAVTSLHVDAEFVGVGVNATVEFDLDHIPIEGSLKLYVNDVLQVEGTHFEISGLTITFTTAPTVGHGITASYDYAADADTFENYDDELLENLINAATKKAENYTGRAFVQRTVTERHLGEGSKVMTLYKRPISSFASVAKYYNDHVGTGDGSTVEFTLDNTPLGDIELYIDGTEQTLTTDYTISGKTITFGSAPGDETRISADYKIRLSDYLEQLSVGRLTRELTWVKDYIYEVIYTAGYGDRAATQALVPDAVAAVLLILANLFENRTDLVKGEVVAGLGSVTYDIPSQAKELLAPLKVGFL